MQKSILSIFSIILLSFNLVAQDGCSTYYPMTEGSSFEYTSYNKKGKVESVANYLVSSVTTEGSATIATLDFKISDKKGKELFESNYSYTCENDIVKIDFKSLFPAEMMNQYSEMDVEMDISGIDIEIPNNLEVGQELSDANVAINMNMSGIKMNFTVDQTERKVEKKESITNAVGSFDCFVITEKTRSKAMGVNMEVTSKIWLAKGVGVIKQETYKKNGDLISSTALTKYSK